MIPVHRVKPSHSEVTEKTAYGLYKEALQGDFNASCGYCDCPDVVWGGKAGFQIDHFAPQKRFPELRHSYKNLIYSCPICNRGKSNLWVSDSSSVSFQNEEGFIHPCEETYEEHLGRSPSGQIFSKTSLGGYMHDKLKLGLKRHEIIWMKEELRCLISQVKRHVDTSPTLKQRYLELTEKYFEYDEVLRSMIDQR